MGHSNIDPRVLQTARETVGLYLKGIRELRGLSQDDLAEKAAMDLDLIVQMEEGSGDYSFDDFISLTSFLDCYFYLADKGGKHLDADDMIKKSKDPI